MSWHERSERQVGAEGINEIREWLEVSAAADAAARPARAHVASLLVMLVAIAIGMLLGPTSTPAAAAPLPAGTYQVEVDGGTIVLDVDTAGRPDLTASDGLRVTLTFDDRGRVLDEFTVVTDDGPMTVEVDPGTATDAYTVTTIPAPPEGLPGRPTDLDTLLPGDPAPDTVDAGPTGATRSPRPTTGQERSDQVRPTSRPSSPPRPTVPDARERRGDNRPQTAPGQEQHAPPTEQDDATSEVGNAPTDDPVTGDRPSGVRPAESDDPEPGSSGAAGGAGS